MAENKWTCECGQENTGKFCVSCGKSAPEMPAAPEAPVAPEAPAAPEEPAVSIDDITEPVAPLVGEEEVKPVYEADKPAKVDPDDFKPVEPDHSPKPAPSAGPVPGDTSDPDNFVPAPMHPEKKTNQNYGSAPASSSSSEPGYTQALIGMILGICSIVLLWVPILATGLAIAGLILAIVSKNKGYEGGMRKAALILSIIAIVLSILGTIGCFACLAAAATA